ncbi:MAG: hypothetical protein EOM20_08055 [Spartobacteria bacterium]|nr:hypothetical protein [Spartobacteria bacterium]
MIKYGDAARKRDAEISRFRGWPLFVRGGNAAALALLLGLAACPGCKPGRRAQTRVHVREPVCIVKPAANRPGAQENFALLSALYPEALVLEVRDFPAIVQYCLVGDRVLLVPDVAGFPVVWWHMLEEYLQRGGLAFFMGAYPFSDRMAGTEGNALTQEEFVWNQVGQAQHVDGISAIQLWRHVQGERMARGTVRVARHRDLPWDGVEVLVEDFEDSAVMQLDEWPPGTMAPDLNALVFFARGDAQTTGLALTCSERDGALWRTTVPLLSGWRPYLLHEREFAYLGGGDPPGKDHYLSFANITGMEIGLLNEAMPQEPGKHVFGLSDVRMLLDPRTPEDILRQPDIDPLSPACRHYSTEGDEVASLMDNRQYRVKGLRFQSPFYAANGWGGERGTATRLIPLYEGKDKMDVSRGWPVSLHMRAPEGGRPPRLWAWAALHANNETRAMLDELIPATITRLYQRMFLYRAGCEKSVFGPNENIQASAQWISGCASGQPLRISAELHDARGQTLRRVVSDAIPAREKGSPYGPIALNLGLTPDLKEQKREYTIRMALEDAQVRGRVYDEVFQSVKILPATADDDRVVVSGARFRDGRRPAFMLGVTFQPLIGHTACARAPSASWLNIGYFNPLRIARELDQLETMGINALALSYDAVEQAPQLRFFADEAGKHRMRIYLNVAGLSPFAFDAQRAQALIEAADLAHAPAVFAFDVSCDADGDLSDAYLVAAWRRWLIEQYGSFGHAVDVLGYSLWARGDGPGLPPDSALYSDGDHRAAVAVFRRFVDDYMSRLYGYIRRFIRAQGCSQLLSASCRCGPGRDFGQNRPRLFSDPASGIQHMDFVSLDAGRLTGSNERFQEAVFLAAYARGVSGGKPVVWMDYGIPVGTAPELAQLRNQARIGEQMLELSSRSMASGCFAGVPEEPGVALMHPDGTWRPVAEIIRRYARKLLNDTQQPSLWKGREFRRSVDARGLPALWARWKDVYRGEVASGHIEEVRPYGFGQNTMDMALVSVGNVAFVDPAPLEYANAEWGAIRVDDQPVLRAPGATLDMRAGQTAVLEVINTGIATWSASQQDKVRTVWMEARQEDGKTTLLQIGVVPSGQSTEFTWVAPSPGRWRLRPRIQGVGAFGEPLLVAVKE